MNEYRIKLHANFAWTEEHIEAMTAQEAVDQTRKEYKDCYVVRVAQVVSDWK